MLFRVPFATDALDGVSDLDCSIRQKNINGI